MAHLLIVTHESIGRRLDGPGMRYVEIARAIDALPEHEVTLAARQVEAGAEIGPRLVQCQPGDGRLPLLLDEVDAVLCLGFTYSQYAALWRTTKPLIIDLLYDVHQLERLTATARLGGLAAEHLQPIGFEKLMNMFSFLYRGDFFICASERQRDFWLGLLLAFGRLNAATVGHDLTLRRLIDVVPFGISASPPRHTQKALKGVMPGIGAEDKLIVWHGGIWDWLDPLTLIEAAALVAERHPSARVFFACRQHFDADMVPSTPMAERLLNRSQELGLLERTVFFGNWVPYEERDNYLLEADVGVSLHVASIETRFAVRARLLDYIWAGLPMVCTAGDELSEQLAREGLATLVPPGDKRAATDAICELLDAPHAKEQRRQAFARFASRFLWPVVVEPLRRFLEAPGRAADAATRDGNANPLASLQRERDAWRERYEQLHEHLEAVQQGRVMRFLNWLSRAERR